MVDLSLFHCISKPTQLFNDIRKLIKYSCDGFRVEPVLEKHETALLMLLGFGGFSIILALLYNAVRKYVFHDEHNLDSTFDAGGNVTLSLTAVTVASQMFWPGDILHSATLTTKVHMLLTYAHL